MKSLSFVIPIYNESKRLHKTFEALQGGFSFSGIKLEKVIFVDDGSIDNTKDKIKRQKLKLKQILKAKIEVISYPINRGKGYAVKQGMLASDSDYTLFFDADMSTPLSEFSKLMPHIQKQVDVLVGTRKNGHSTVVKHQPLYRELLGRGFTLISQLILNTWVTDFTCGFKAFSRTAKNEIFPLAQIERWSYDSEILYLGRMLGYKLQEVPVLWKNDEGTKVNLLKDIPKTLIDLISIRLSKYTVQSMVRPFVKRLAV